MKYDSERGAPIDFAEAVHHWQTALTMEPANYIWRRRLQQYGPRLDKPYPFYDWIAQARKDLLARGEQPHPLVTEPHGAEVARPLRKPEPAQPHAHPHPDPQNKLRKDVNESLFSYQTTYVSHTSEEDVAYRVFLEIQPKEAFTKWNDEAGLSTVRITPPEHWEAIPTVTSLLPRTEGDLQAARLVEFELRRKNDRADDLPPETSLQIFLQTCYGQEGRCELIRRDLLSAPPVAMP
jgi:hypothetical protein